MNKLNTAESQQIYGVHLNQSKSAPKQKSKFLTDFENNFDLLTELNDKLHKLEERLDPILSCPLPQNNKEENPVPPSCQLLLQNSKINCSIKSCLDVLASINNRIEPF